MVGRMALLLAAALAVAGMGEAYATHTLTVTPEDTAYSGSGPWTDPGAKCVTSGGYVYPPGFTTSTITHPVFKTVDSIDGSIPGTFTVTYVCNDGTHTEEATRSIKVGGAKPVLILNTTDLLVNPKGAGLPDFDPRDVVCLNGDGAVGTVTRDRTNFNINAVGAGTVSYACTISGQAADALVRSGGVIDPEDPTIELVGFPRVVVATGTTYRDAGAICVDPDGGFLDVLNNGTAVADVAKEHTTRFWCAGFDSTEVHRKVVVEDSPAEDTTRPTFDMATGPSTIRGQGVHYAGLDITCSDDVNGDGFPSDVISSTSGGVTTVLPDHRAAHTTTVTIVLRCTDAAGNTNTLTLTPTSNNAMFSNADTHPPFLQVIGGRYLEIPEGNGGQRWHDPGAACTDSVSVHIDPVASGKVDITTVGRYVIDYTCQDGVGQAAWDKRIVDVVPVTDTEAPDIFLTGPTSGITFPSGEDLVEPGVVCRDNVDGNLTNAETLTITSTPAFDKNSGGDYTFTYTCTDLAMNTGAGSTASRMGSVPDADSPKLTLTGPNPITVIRNDSVPYTDPLGTCLDRDDNPIDRSNIVAGDVDTIDSHGTKTVTITCTDPTRSKSTSEMRTVIVLPDRPLYPRTPDRSTGTTSGSRDTEVLNELSYGSDGLTVSIEKDPSQNNGRGLAIAYIEIGLVGGNKWLAIYNYTSTETNARTAANFKITASATVPEEILKVIADDPAETSFRVALATHSQERDVARTRIEHPAIGVEEYKTFSSFNYDSVLLSRPIPILIRADGTTTTTNVQTGGNHPIRYVDAYHILDQVPPTLVYAGPTEFRSNQNINFEWPTVKCTDDVRDRGSQFDPVVTDSMPPLDTSTPGTYTRDFECDDNSVNSINGAAQRVSMSVEILALPMIPGYFTDPQDVTTACSDVAMENAVIFDTSINGDRSMSVTLDHTGIPDNQSIAYYQVQSSIDHIEIFDFQISGSTTSFTVPTIAMDLIQENDETPLTLRAVISKADVTVAQQQKSARFISINDILLGHLASFDSFKGPTILTPNGRPIYVEPPDMNRTREVMGSLPTSAPECYAAQGPAAHLVPPVITLKEPGKNPHEVDHVPRPSDVAADDVLPYGDLDPGATCTDLTDPTKDAGFEAGVDLYTLGMQRHNYTCTDSDGNDAVEVTRWVDVKDRTAPEIVPNFANNTEAEAAEPITVFDTGTRPSYGCMDQAGQMGAMDPAAIVPLGNLATDIDGKNGMIVGGHTLGGTIDFDRPLPGDWGFQMTCSDSETPPNTRTETWVIKVRDRSPPKIDIVDPSFTIQNQTVVLPIGICRDLLQGNFETTAEPVSNAGIDKTKLGSNEVSYECVDRYGYDNSTTGDLQVVRDEVPPKILVDLDTGGVPSWPLYLLDPSAEFMDIGATCTDNLPDPRTSTTDIPLANPASYDPPGYGVFPAGLPSPLEPPEPPYERLPAKSFVRTYFHSYLGVIDQPRPEYVGEMNATFSCRDNFDNRVMNWTSVVSTRNAPSIILHQYVRADNLTISGVDEVTLEQGELYLEPGAVCLDPRGTFQNPMATNATVGGDRVQTSELGEYMVEYTCSIDGAGSAAPVTRLVTVVEEAPEEQRARERPTFTFKDEPFFGSMRITQAPGAKFDETQIKCTSQDGDPLIPLITAAAFIDETPLKIPEARLGDGRIDVAVSNRVDANEAGAVLKVLTNTIRYGIPERADIDLENGLTVAEFIRKAPAGRYVALYDCEDNADPQLASRVSLDILIIKRSSEEDWKLNPTFGRTWDSNELRVTQGFSFNGRTFDVTDNFHVDFARQSSEIGQVNTVTMKAYAPVHLETMTLSLGVPDLSRFTDAEAHIYVDVIPNYDLEAEYEIVAVRHEQPDELVDVDVTSATVEKKKCNAEQEITCHEFTISFAVTAPLKSDVMAISAMDVERRETTTYVNDGVEFTGEPTLPAKTATFTIKRGNQHPVETYHLVQDDRRYDVWTDQDGFAWLRNSYGSWFQLTQAGFERLADPHVSVMTRSHGSFADLVEEERRKAALVFDAESIRSEVGESFSIDAPVRVEKLKDPVVLEKLRISEQLALEYLESYE
ncbi:exported hypothetical protein [Nitrosopumilaceae archaeon]|nr:DUF5011 domain-containing protein [Nitrosopumilus sp.]MDA7944261.1 DUF5011 domain-containing protein [Nitrosopumilus sp.]MDA7954013.1 DUF5011 domain-containing protein [Nitrosopumilus sp.]MDA7972941.1 DUF5011 domain-containing protein [Nitrosopumilus sp.]CAI9831362.1 exported hypothetical protein [Nitrosopumilaceae archaeon]